MMSRLFFALAAAALLPATALAQPRINVHAVRVSGPATAVVGRTVSIIATIESTGSDLPGPFRWTAHLTTNGSLDGSHELGTFGPITLSGPAPRVLTQSVQLPAGVTGRWTLAIEADSAAEVDEFDDYDNIAFATSPIVIRDEMADADVTSVTIASGSPSLRAGEPIHIRWSITNRGELGASFTVGAYFSSDDVVSTSDALIGESTVSIPAGQNASGVIDGVVPSGALPGDYAIGAIADAAGTVDEISDTNNVASRPRAVNIYTDTLAVDLDTLPNGTLGIAYHAQLHASGGDGHYRWRLASGDPPDGLSLNEVTGEITGTPSVSGMFTLAIAATSHGLSAQKMYTVRIFDTGASLQIVSREISDGALGYVYEQTLVASGGEPPYTWSIAPDAPDVPPGLDLRTDGVIIGVPTVLGTFHFGIQVIDHAGDRDFVELELDVSPPVNVLILHRELPEATIGVEIDYALQATGGIPPYSWAALSTLPPGVILTEQGHLTGVPSKVGTFPVRVRATDSTRVRNDDTTLIQLTVKDDGALGITTATNLPIVVVRTRYEVQLDAMGGEPPLTWSLVPGDHLPGGFFMIPGDGMAHPENSAVIKGTALRPQFHAFAVQVEDAFGRRDQRVMLLEVAIPPDIASDGCMCVGAAGRSDAGALIVLLVLLVLLIPGRERRMQAKRAASVSRQADSLRR